MEVATRRKAMSSGHKYSRDRDREHHDREKRREKDRDMQTQYEFDFNDISRASTPTSTFSSKSEGRRREKEHTHKYSVDDYKRKIARLKSELDLEKARSKKAQKEKSVELREIRESFEIRQQSEINDLELQLKKKLEKDSKHLEENLRKSIMEQKDKELQDVLKYKEEELREMRKKYKQEKENAIKLAIENEKNVLTQREKEMEDEMEALRKEKETMEEEYKKKVAEEARKEKEFSKIKEEYDGEMRRILGESKKLALGNLEKLKKAEKTLNEHCDSDDELNDMEFNEIMADLQAIQSQTSSRAVSRSVSTTSELKFDELNMHINNLLASPAVTPGLPGNVTPGMYVGPGIMAGQSIEGPSPLTVKGVVGENKRSTSAMSEPSRDVFNRGQVERDRQLAKKVSELQTQTQRLERKIALLKTENETLKRKQDDIKPLEDKIKTLKKRNAELAAIARRLEEKAKHLQQENIKRQRELQQVGSTQVGTAGAHSTDQMKKVFARQRAKDLAEHAKQMLSKDREIEDLRSKCQELADQLSNADFLGPENSEMYEEKEELVSIIKQAAKERLSMERQLAIAKPGPDSKLVSSERYKELEETNEALKREIGKLERALTDTERLEIELTQKKLECERLTKDIEQEKLHSKQLESNLVDSEEARAQLSKQVVGLQQRLIELEKVNEECSTLRLSLSEAQHECEVAKGEVSVLQLKIQNLETVVQNLEFSTEKLKQVEKDYQDTLHKLQTKQREIDDLQKVQESAREKYETAIKSLQDKISGLETQCKQQASKQQELTDELTQLRAAQSVKKTHKNLSHTEVQCNASLEFAPSSTSSPNQSPRQSPIINNSNHGNSRKSPSKSPAAVNTPSSISAKSPGVAKSPANSGRGSSSSSLVNNKTPSSPSSSHTVPIINKGANSNNKNSNTPVNEVVHVDHSVPALHTPQRKVNGVLESSEPQSGGTDTGFADDDDVNAIPDSDKYEDPELLEIAEKLKELENQSDSEDSVKSDKGEDSGMESRGDHRADREISEMSVTESRLSVLAKKGPIQVYVAKYSYDPFKYSPNENPEMELPLSSGDYVLIYGEMDEDGFFDGELIDGRRGLVPSNFIEKVADDDLPEFHAAVAKAGHEEDSTAANSIAVPDLDTSEEFDRPDDLPADSSRLKGDPSSDLENIDEEEEDLMHGNHGNTGNRDAQHTGTPFPKQLKLDRQLANSILVSWMPPDNVAPGDVRSYHVFLDGDFKMAVRGSERTKALLENVESRKIHRVSVRCISAMGQSHDNQCTILVGKEIVPAPYDLRVTDITANSATITWTPGDSCLQHAVLVNSAEVRVVKPGVYSYTLTGLSPATTNSVKIQAKTLSGKYENNNVKQDRLAATVEFTTAKGGAPDPPVNIQVESGPQEGSILLTWLPVTIDTPGYSNGALVSGYVVYADGQKIKQVLGATNDHSILSSEDFRGFVPKELYVSTIAKDKVESGKSEVVRLPHSLIEEITMGTNTLPTDTSSQKSPMKPRNADDEIDSAFEKINQVYVQQPAVVHTQNFPEPFYDSSCSELSDIPEVDEPSSPDSTNENSSLKVTLKSLVNGISNLSNDSAEFEEIYQTNLTQERLAESLDSEATPTGDMSDATPTPLHKNVPQIEITHEDSREGYSPHRDTDKPHVKTDSVESSKSSKVTKQHGGDSDASKYSNTMDSRDRFRDDKQSHSPRERHRESTDNAYVKHSNDARSPHSASHQQSPSLHHRHARSASPGARHSPRGQESPRSQSSPRDPSKRGRENHDKSPRDHKHSSASPHGDRKGHNSAKHSPVPSPNSKTNAKNNSYTVEPLELSKVSSIEKDVADSRYLESDDDSITGEINPPVDDSRIRLFVALFDYDPESMSPNVDSLDEELPFREGQIIKVYGDKDADGFYRGECAGRIGYIPCNMVSEIQVDDPELEEQLYREAQENGSMATAAITEQLSASDKYLKPITANGLHGAAPGDLTNDTTGEVTVRRMVAVYDYDPQELSPNVDAEVELSFKSGELIICYGEMDDDGFYMGEIGSRRGLVPSNFLQETSASDEEVLDSVSVMTPARSGESINTSDSRKSLKSEKSEKIMSEVHKQLPGRGDQSSTPQSGKPGVGVHPAHPEQLRDGRGVDDVTSTAVGSPTRNQTELDNADIGMARPRSLTPDELKQKQKKGGFFSKGKNILKKFTR